MFSIQTIANGRQFTGTSGADSTLAVVGASFAGDDIILGRGGDDVLGGRGGNDTINGGAGNDRLWGHKGHDAINGGVGNDRLWGGEGHDRLWGGKGHDVIDGGAGNDRLRGDTGHDAISGGVGNDRLWGGEGNDRLWGGKGHDVIDGGAGHDRLWGGEGSDVLFGCKGNDLLSGGKGDDSINGAAGNDWILTGEGNDVVRYRVASDSARDVVKDFDVKTRANELDSDTLNIEWNGLPGDQTSIALNTAQQFADFIVFIETDNNTSTDAIQSGNDLVLKFDDHGNRIVLKDVFELDGDNLVGFRGESDAPVQDTTLAQGVFSWLDVIDVA